MDRWLLEHDNEGEVYTRPRTDEPTIEGVLNLFNGKTTFYCCLFDTTDESCLWCIGQSDRCIIEGRLFEDHTMFHFVLRRQSAGEVDSVTLRYGMEANELIEVARSEILTETEAITIFKDFYRSKSIPDGYIPVAKTCLFGSLSFKDRASAQDALQKEAFHPLEDDQ